MEICAFIILFTFAGELQSQKIVKFGRNNGFSIGNHIRKFSKFKFDRVHYVKVEQKKSKNSIVY